MPGTAPMIGLMHGDVQPGEPDHVAGGREPAGVTGSERIATAINSPNPELTHQQLAARLATTTPIKVSFSPSDHAETGVRGSAKRASD
jgi:hypothetical protein